MTHDPLCHVTWMDSSICAQCRLIARVREDGYRTGYGAAMQEGWDGYGAALRDAVEAVAALRGENENVLPRQFRAQALAAIRGLGGER